MKKPNQVKELNFNDLSFFMGIRSIDAKWIVSGVLNEDKAWDENNLTKTGAPAISNKDYVNKEQVDVKIRSNSALDGKSTIDYHVSQFNKGVPTNTLREYSQKPTFLAALKFTGKYEILNHILNEDQIRKLQKTWLAANTQNAKRYWSKKTSEFISNNEWAKEAVRSKQQA